MTADIQKIVNSQKSFFNKGKTKNLDFRLTQLSILEMAVIKNETRIISALKKDLGKSAYESFMTEVGFVTDEIRLVKKHLKAWAKPRRVSTPLKLLPSMSRIYHEPYGVCLIMSPWNYPVQLTLSPLIGAMSAGNCGVIKPSEHSPATSEVIGNMCKDYFSDNYIAVVQGGVGISTALLKENFDYIFFTGSPDVGKIVMTAAANNLVPVTLELGGKSPCIVDYNVDIGLASKRIVSGKFLNAGQTCVAPDYLMVHKTVKNDLVSAMVMDIENFYGHDPQESPDYGRIINQRHFDRLTRFLETGKIVFGGITNRDDLYMAPTLIENLSWNDAVMREEIFGPVLPIFEFEDLDEAINLINDRPRPLALYFFSRNKKNKEKILTHISFGGGCINDTVLHVANPHLPFGGVGNSGIGNYHGKAGFETFSHQKSVLSKPFCFDISLRFPPYKGKFKYLKTVFNLPFYR
jgi:aldehyde dehydrogenase (NAD+)